MHIYYFKWDILFIKVTIIYIGNWKGSIDMPSEIVSSFSKVSGYKAKWKRLFLYARRGKKNKFNNGRIKTSKYQIFLNEPTEIYYRHCKLPNIIIRKWKSYVRKDYVVFMYQDGYLTIFPESITENLVSILVQKSYIPDRTKTLEIIVPINFRKEKL